MDDRLKLYNLFNRKSGVGFTNFKKTIKLGEGDVGKVFKTCDKKRCVARKQVYINKKEVKYVEDITNKKALKYSIYIELESMSLTDTLVLNNICPHFVLNYNYTYKYRESSADICKEEYPAKFILYNELVNNSITLKEWVDEDQSIEDIYNVFFQITMGLYAMKKHFNMIHMDLHSENILIEMVKPGGYYIYKLNKKTYKIPNTGFLVYINDFGHSYIPGVLESWFVRTRYNKKSITFGFDINILLKSLKIDKQIRKDMNYIKKEQLSVLSIQTVFHEMFQKTKFKKILNVYNLDKEID
jgi:hypothetical protein